MGTREKMLECLLMELFEMDQGVYPQSVSGAKDPKNNYEKRSEFQEGWNKAVMDRIEKEDELYKILGVSITDDGIEFL